MLWRSFSSRPVWNQHATKMNSSCYPKTASCLLKWCDRSCHVWTGNNRVCARHPSFSNPTSPAQPANLVMHHGFPFPLPRLRINKRPARHKILSGKSCPLLLAKTAARLLGKPRTLQGCLPLRTRQGVIQPPLPLVLIRVPSALHDYVP